MDGGDPIQPDTPTLVEAATMEIVETTQAIAENASMTLPEAIIAAVPTPAIAPLPLAPIEDFSSSTATHSVEIAVDMSSEQLRLEPATDMSSLQSALDIPPSPQLVPLASTKVDVQEVESGYGSAEPSLYASPSLSTASLPQVALTPAHLRHLNDRLERMSPLDIVRFTSILFPNLYQSTAFGLTGMITIHMLSKIQKDSPLSPKVDVFFLDTLFHFKETYDLVDRVRERYPETRIHVFKPWGAETAGEFEALYGEKLYELSGELYDWTAKVEPLQRAYAELNVAAVLTGRRRSQGGDRDHLPVIELDDERGVIKINPFISWSYEQVIAYVKENDIPYNALIDQGYKSIGDWHSTSPVTDGEDERAGRWKGQSKTECGIHNKKSRYALYLEEVERKEQEEALAAASAALQLVSQERHIVEVA